MAETLCTSFQHQYGIPFKSLRIWHTYAPTMDVNNDPRVFASFMKNILKGENIVIKSDGTAKRSFCYIADALAAMFTVLTNGNDNEAYNICNTEQFVSIKELALTLAGLRDDVKVSVTWEERRSDEHYIENTAIGQIPPSNAKLKGLGWEAKYDISTGFQRVFSYLKANE